MPTGVRRASRARLGDVARRVAIRSGSRERLALRGGSDLQPLHAAVQRRAVDPQLPGSELRVSVHTFQRVAKLPTRQDASIRHRRVGAMRHRRDDDLFVNARVGKRAGPLDHLLQLAHIARPIVRLEEARRTRGRRDATKAGTIEKDADEYRDVLGSIGERRNVHHDRADPMGEVGAEAMLPNEGVEALVRGGDDAKLAARIVSRSDGTELAGLDRAKELRLERHGKATDLVEERGPAVRLAQKPLRVAEGARKGAAHVSEERVLEHRIADCADIERDEPPASSTRGMQRRRNELLSGSRRAFDEDGEGGRGGREYQGSQLADWL